MIDAVADAAAVDHFGHWWLQIGGGPIHRVELWPKLTQDSEAT
jgi:hypothetical protein